jgi:hypothetical protein
MKTSQNYIFHPREAHTLTWLDIKVVYTIFWAFEKYRYSAQNTKKLAFSFTEKRLFVTKID